MTAPQARAAGDGDQVQAFLNCSLDWTLLDTALVGHELATFEPLLQRVDAEAVTAMVEAGKDSMNLHTSCQTPDIFPTIAVLSRFTFAAGG